MTIEAFSFFLCAELLKFEAKFNYTKTKKKIRYLIEGGVRHIGE